MNGPMLWVQQVGARRQVLGDFVVILEILFVGGDPDGDRRMVANVPDVVVIERGGALCETPVVGIPRL